MTKIKKYALSFTFLFASIILAGGSLFTIMRIQSQRQNNYFFEKIEGVNLMIKNGNKDKAITELANTQNSLKASLWDKKGYSNKEALIALIYKKLGVSSSTKVISDYISKAESYENFNLVKECLLRLFLLEKESYEKIQKFRWKHNMQRMHLLSTIKTDLRYKDLLPKQTFDFYLRNLPSFNHQLELEMIFIIMAAS